MEQDREIDPNWYAESFGELYSLIYAHRSVEAARDEVRFAAEAVKLQPTDRVLDLACGGGRHMTHLHPNVDFLVGLDYSSTLLAMAQRERGESFRLVRADMRAVPFVAAFDVVFNFFTSFGYFRHEDENRMTVQSVARSLRSEGRFFIDYINPDAVRRGLEPHSVRKAGLYTVDDTRWIDDNEGRINKRTRVSRENRYVATFEESVRLYAPEEFEQLLLQGGLRIERFYGDFSGADLSPDSQRMIAVGHKTG